MMKYNNTVIITSQAVDIPVRRNGLGSPSAVGCEKSMSAPSGLTLLTRVNPEVALEHPIAVLARGIRQ